MFHGSFELSVRLPHQPAQNPAGVQSAAFRPRLGALTWEEQSFYWPPASGKVVLTISIFSLDTYVFKPLRCTLPVQKARC